MSHVVQIQAEVRDVAAIRGACRRIGLPDSVFGEVKLFSGSKIGWPVHLPGWKYPVVIDVNSGRVDFDNFEGRWGEQKELDNFLQKYTVEKARIEAQKKGHSITEQELADGSIKLTIEVGGAA